MINKIYYYEEFFLLNDMTIALFIDSYLPTKNGVITVVIQLQEQLKKMGHRVILVCPKTTKEFDTDNTDIYRVKSLQDNFLKSDQYFSTPFDKKNICKFIKENKVDIIHCHTDFSIGRTGIYIAKKLRIPAICTTHTMWPDNLKYLKIFNILPSKSILNFMIDYYKKFDALIGVSSKSRNYYKKNKKLSKVPAVIIPNAINVNKFDSVHITEQEKHELRAKYGISDNEVLFLYLGRIAEEKRIFELSEKCIQLLENQPNVKIIFVGKGPAFEELTKKLKKQIQDKKIILTGFIDWTEVHKYYEMSDVFITASLSEMHSMTILEAQLSSLPIIARDDESYLDCIIPNKNGYLAKTDDEFYNDMIEMANDEEKRKFFAKNSFEQSKKFSLETNVKKTVFLYEQVIKAYPKKIDEADITKQLENIF